MAAALFRQYLQHNQPSLDGWQIESAGTWTKPGRKAMSEALQAMKRRGLDLSGHRSQVVSRELLSNFRLILTMEPGQKEALQIEFPELAKRVYLLSEMAGEQKTVRDPIGGSPDDFEKTAQELERLIAAGCHRICALAASSP